MKFTDRIKNVYLPYLGFVGCIRFSKKTENFFYEPKDMGAVLCRSHTLDECIEQINDMYVSCIIK